MKPRDSARGEGVQSEVPRGAGVSSSGSQALGHPGATGVSSGKVKNKVGGTEAGLAHGRRKKGREILLSEEPSLMMSK